MPWIESHTTIGSHPKTRKLAHRLDVSIPEAVGILHLLWHFAIEYAKDGDLSKHDLEDIAFATYYEDDPQKLLSELKACGWVDDDLRVHDWDDFAGRLIERWNKDAERKRAWRTRQGRDVDATKEDQDATRDGARTSPHLTNLTSPTSPRPTSNNDGTEAQGDPKRAVVNRLSSYCTGKDRASVYAEAHRLVDYCCLYLDVDVVDEAVGWAMEKFGQDPQLPRALVPTIESFAQRRNVTLPQLKEKVTA